MVGQGTNPGAWGRSAFCKVRLAALTSYSGINLPTLILTRDPSLLSPGSPCCRILGFGQW